MTLIEKLEAVGYHIAHSETPRESAIWVLGAAMGFAIRAGWTFDEFKALESLPAEVVELFEKAATTMTGASTGPTYEVPSAADDNKPPWFYVSIPCYVTTESEAIATADVQYIRLKIRADDPERAVEMVRTLLGIALSFSSRYLHK